VAETEIVQIVMILITAKERLARFWPFYTYRSILRERSAAVHWERRHNAISVNQRKDVEVIRESGRELARAVQKELDVSTELVGELRKALTESRLELERTQAECATLKIRLRNIHDRSTPDIPAPIKEHG
jgi:hypothetical protein